MTRSPTSVSGRHSSSSLLASWAGSSAPWPAVGSTSAPSLCCPCCSGSARRSPRPPQWFSWPSTQSSVRTSIKLDGLCWKFYFSGFYWRQMMTDTGVEPDAWGYLIVCVPIVVIFAPLGSIISSHFHRQVLAFLIYILDTVALVTAFIVIPITLELGIMWSVLKHFRLQIFSQIFSSPQWLFTGSRLHSLLPAL